MRHYRSVCGLLCAGVLATCDAAELIPNDPTVPVPVTPDRGTYRVVLNPRFMAVTPGSAGVSVLSMIRENGFAGKFSVVAASDAQEVLRISVEQGGNDDTYIVRVVVDSTAAPGAYVVTLLVGVVGRAGGESTNLSVTVPHPVTVTSCNGSFLFMAAQNGDGAWVPITDAASVLSLDWPAGRGALARVEGYNILINDQLVPRFDTTVLYGTTAELVAALRCPTPARGYILGNVLNGGDDVKAAMGQYATRLMLASSFALQSPSTLSDVVVWNMGSGFPQRGIIRRDLNAVGGLTLPVFDFSSAEAFTFGTRRLVIPDVDVSEVGMQFRTANGTIAPLTCYSFVYNYDFCSVVSPVIYPAVAQPREGDAHRLHMWLNDRFMMTCLKNAVDHEFIVPASLNGINVTSVAAAPSRRYRVTYNRQPDYNGGVRARFTNTQPPNTLRTVEVHVSGGYLGNAALADVTIPALDAVSGWKAEWGLLPGAQYEFEARGWTEPNTANSALCGQEWLPFLWPERPQASQLRAAWISGTVLP